MDVLIVTLRHQLYWRTLDSIHRLKAVSERDRQDHIVVSGGVGDLLPDGRDRINSKMNRARALALRGGYDAMLTVEADNIPPADALIKLSEALRNGADVAYGVYALRYEPYHWNPFCFGAEKPMLGFPIATNSAPESVKAWVEEGATIPVDGVGWGTTLISRRALEATPFVAEGEPHPNGDRSFNDWYTALEWKRQGLTSVAHFGVLVGHISLAPTKAILWPSVDRIDESPPRLYQWEYIS